MQRMHTVAIQHDRFEHLILNFTTGTNAEHYRSQNQIVRDHSLKNSLVVYALKTDYTMPFSKKATIYIQIAGVLLLSAQLSLLWAQSALTAKGGSQMLRPPHELLHEEASATTYFKVARLYGDSNHPHFNPDSSYHYARLASRHFRYLGKRDQKQLEKEGITQRSINRFRSEQKEEALHFAIQKNTIEAIDAYLENYPRAKDEWKAMALRHKYDLQFQAFQQNATYEDLLKFLRKEELPLNRYYPELLPKLYDLSYQKYFETHSSSDLLHLLQIVYQLPEIAARIDSTLSAAVGQQPYLGIVEPYLAKAKKEDLPMTMNTIYQYYAFDGKNRHLYTFASRYPEFKTSPHFNRDLAIANIGPKIQGRRVLKKEDLVNYIEMGAPRYLAFEALQLMIKRDIDIQNWSGALRSIEEYAAHFGENNRWINDLRKQLETELTTERPENLGLAINSNAMEYAPVLTADEQTIYFCRGQKGGGEDIYFSHRKDGKWSAARPVPGLNTIEGNEAPLSVSADGNTLLYFRSGRVMYSDRTGEGWSAGKSLFNEKQASEWQGGTCIAADGQTIIFAARRPNRVGLADEENTDLFVVTKLEDGSWSDPVNLGLTINTPLEDRSPFLHPDMRTLYFSSNGHGGLGEHDVFKTTRIGDSWTEWTKPVNLGKTVNTTGKDWGYRISTDGQFAYFSTRVPQFGDDLFRIPLPEFAQPQLVGTIKGSLKNLDGAPLEAPLVIENLETGEIVKEVFPDPTNGDFFITLPVGAHYSYTVKNEDYFPVGNNIDLTKKGRQVVLEEQLVVPSIREMIERGISLPLKNLFFETAKHDIKPASFPELKKLIRIMKERDLRVDISGFTDNVGAADYNLELSQARADAVKSFLIAQGCPADWITAQGYGMNYPVSDNATAEGRAQNRRVEIKLSAQP